MFSGQKSECAARGKAADSEAPPSDQAKLWLQDAKPAKTPKWVPAGQTTPDPKCRFE